MIRRYDMGFITLRFVFGSANYRKGEDDTMKYKLFRHAALGKLCRECLNQKYGLQLKRYECRYRIIPTFCDGCVQPKNIVTDIEVYSRWKIWRMKKLEPDQNKTEE